MKIGLFPASRGDTEAGIEAAGRPSDKTYLIAVLFADQSPDFSLLDPLAEAGFCGVMLDTMEKGGGGLTRHLSSARLQEFVARAGALNLMSGLAGSLEAPDIQRLGVLKPDYLGFRGALTSGLRDAAIDEARVREMARLIAGITQSATLRPASSHDASPSQPMAAQALNQPAIGDRVFVKDFVLPLEIGAYAHEYDRTQDGATPTM